MGKNEYVGKRITVTMPEEIYNVIEKLAKEETRSNSQTALHLIQAGIKSKGIKIND
ncbi:MAG: hypothetical protein AAFS12_01620 [Cyanobacteria bacterium J06632_19]